MRRPARIVVAPLITLGIVVAVLLLYMATVVPKFREVFRGLPGGEEGLPAITRAMMAASAWLVRFWWTLPLALAAVALTLRLRKGRRQVP